jgi:hypothetical protein
MLPASRRPGRPAWTGRRGRSVSTRYMTRFTVASNEFAGGGKENVGLDALVGAELASCGVDEVVPVANDLLDCSRTDAHPHGDLRGMRPWTGPDLAVLDLGLDVARRTSDAGACLSWRECTCPSMASCPDRGERLGGYADRSLWRRGLRVRQAPMKSSQTSQLASSTTGRRNGPQPCMAIWPPPASRMGTRSRWMYASMPAGACRGTNSASIGSDEAVQRR